MLRRFYVDPVVAECLGRYVEDELRPTLPTGAAADPVACQLFPRCHTSPTVCLTPSQLHFWFRRLRARAGVDRPHATIHGFRHFLVTTLMEDKRNRLLDVAQFVGHRSPATTTQYYWHADVLALHHRLVFPWSEGLLPSNALSGGPSHGVHDDERV